eukprot:1790841-Rhodomonas_salina.2
MALRCVLLATSMVCLLFVSSASARHIVADDDKNAIVGHIDYSEPTTYGVQSPEEMAYNLDADEVTLSEIGKDVDHLRSADSYLMSEFARPGPQGPAGPRGEQGRQRKQPDSSSWSTLLVKLEGEGESDPGPQGPPAVATRARHFSTLSSMGWAGHHLAHASPEEARRAQVLRHKLASEGELKKKLANVYELRRRLRATVHKIRTATGQTAAQARKPQR